jgi:PAS domain-containing protein
VALPKLDNKWRTVRDATTERIHRLLGQSYRLRYLLIGGPAWLLLLAAMALLLARLVAGLPIHRTVLISAFAAALLSPPALYVLVLKPFSFSLGGRMSVDGGGADEQKRLFSLLDVLPAIVYLRAPDYSVHFANRQFRTRFGDPDGRLCYRMIYGRDTPCEACATEAVLQERRPIEWEQVYPDGAVYQLYDIPFLDANGAELTLQLGIDVTQRKQIEAELERTNRELRALSRTEHTNCLFAEGLAQAALALNSSLDLEEVLDPILERTQQVIPCCAAALR